MLIPANLLFSYFDGTTNPPRQLSPDAVASRDDTIGPLLLKLFTETRHSLSPTVELGINPYPLSIVSAQLTFLPLGHLHTRRVLVPVSRYNEPLLRPDSASPKETTPSDDSVARVVGYISAAETYSSLKPQLVRIIQLQHGGNAYEEFRRMERRNHQKWLAMDHGSDPDHPDTVESEPMRTASGSKAKSVVSDRSADTRSQSSDGPDRVLVKKEVGAWWGTKLG
jgi:hypothetical protein